MLKLLPALPDPFCVASPVVTLPIPPLTAQVRLLSSSGMHTVGLPEITKSYATHSTSEVVPIPCRANEVVTSALSVDQTSTALSREPQASTPSDCKTASAGNPFLVITTLLDAKEWEKSIKNVENYKKFQKIPYEILQGFAIGAQAPIEFTYIPENHKSTFDNTAAVDDYIATELSVGRYTGPFHPDRLERLIGNFRTSPLGFIPKSDGHFCIIQDFSYPRDSSITSVNEDIDLAGLECNWGTFAQCFLLVTRAPPGTQVAIFDVSAAYRHAPIRLEDQPYLCIQWKGMIYIDHCAPFGLSSSCGLYVKLATRP